MDTGEHFKNITDYELQISAVFGRMRKRKDPLISALNQRVLGSSPSASTKFPQQNQALSCPGDGSYTWLVGVV